jgi:hypothetical protein
MSEGLVEWNWGWGVWGGGGWVEGWGWGVAVSSAPCGPRSCPGGPRPAGPHRAAGDEENVVGGHLAGGRAGGGGGGRGGGRLRVRGRGVKERGAPRREQWSLAPQHQPRCLPCGPPPPPRPPHIAVLRRHHGALDDGQQVALDALAGGVGAWGRRRGAGRCDNGSTSAAGTRRGRVARLFSTSAAPGATLKHPPCCSVPCGVMILSMNTMRPPPWGHLPPQPHIKTHRAAASRGA